MADEAHRRGAKRLAPRLYCHAARRLALLDIEAALHIHEDVPVGLRHASRSHRDTADSRLEERVGVAVVERHIDALLLENLLCLPVQVGPLSGVAFRRRLDDKIVVVLIAPCLALAAALVAVE